MGGKGSPKLGLWGTGQGFKYDNSEAGVRPASFMELSQGIDTRRSFRLLEDDFHKWNLPRLHL